MRQWHREHDPGNDDVCFRRSCLFPPVTQRQPPDFYTTNLTGREKDRLLDRPILDKARQLADIPLLEPRYFHGAVSSSNDYSG
jgi:hypothetical protein